VDGSPLLSLCIFSAVTALLILLACRFLSNRRAIRSAENLYQAHLLELRLFPNQLGVICRTCGKLVGAALGYLIWSLVPLAAAAIPVALLAVQLEMRFAWEPIPPGAPTLLVVHVDEPAAVDRVTFEYPEGVEETGPRLRMHAERAVAVRIRSQFAGRVGIVVREADAQASKEIVTGSGLVRISPERVRGRWFARLRYPGEEGLPREGPISSIAILFPLRFISVGLVELRWFAVYVLLTLAAGAALRPLVAPQAAFVSPLLALPIALLYSASALILWPARRLWHLRRDLRARRKARVTRVVVLGFDGMDPELAARWMRQGKLPHLARLARTGTFRPLATTHPPISQVAWSTFQTGVNPGKHNFFDILGRDRHTHQPHPSGAKVLASPYRLRLGRRVIPLGPPEVQPHRKSRSFWHYLGEAGILSSVIRVPVTFPPEPFSGLLLAGACTPDVRGTPGTFSFFSSREGASAKLEGGTCLQLIQAGDAWRGDLPGPEDPLLVDERRDLTVPLDIRPDAARRRADVEIDGQRFTLRQGRFSGWIRVRFRAGMGVNTHGICRMYLKSLQPDVELYVTPVQLDPRRPALPLSNPPDYSVYLERTQGAFSTLGLPEDVWAINHGVIDDRAFLEQCYQTQAEHEQTFFDALAKTARGACICVFDITDSIQHMFWRQAEPFPRGANSPASLTPSIHQPPDDGVIEALYQRMDALVGRVLDRVGRESLVLVVSAHGFKSFRRAFNLNAWLHQQGYLVLVSGSTVSEERFRQVDWQRTRAYGLGMNGLYLNLAGRERFGIVQPGDEADALRRELREKLRGLADPLDGQVAVREVFDTREVYSGPYLENAPDLLIGYAAGYRVAWESVNGSVMGEVFSDNTRPWSGDHCNDPSEVPGVLFANRPILGDRHSIADIAPTVLQLFGLPVPGHMDGRPWTVHMDAPPAPTGVAATPAPLPGF